MDQSVSRFWKDMTSVELGALDKGRAIAVLPIAAIEQHGPHLPVSTDVCISGGIIDCAVELLPKDLTVVFLPCLEIGVSIEHLAFSGTLSLRAQTAMRYWFDVAASINRAGIRKLVLFNSHGGNPPVTEMVARDLRVRCDMLVAAVSWFDFGFPEGLFNEAERTHGIHGGAVETSMMLHLRPDLVRMERAEMFSSLSMALEDRSCLLTRDGRLAVAWMAQDLNPLGVCGDAPAATAANGAKIIDHTARKLVRLLEEIDRMPISTLKLPT